MREEDRERLRRPYPRDGDPETWFAEALGVFVKPVRELSREIFADLDPERLGVGWWAPHPGASRRILISDHLVSCVDSIQTNLNEAALHLLELIDVWHQTSEFFVDTIQIRGRQIVLNPPPRVSADDDLPMRKSELHTAGFFRAVAGALD